MFSVTRYVQIASAILAVIGLSKDYARHHFHELSGKEKIPGCSNWLPNVSNWLHYASD
jgi:hypothetical protein